MLAETVMLGFRGDVAAKIGHLTGPRLELRAGGRSAQQRFMQEARQKILLIGSFPV